MRLHHAIPSVGPVTVQLYAPADELYAKLHAEREVGRLNSLRHIGALSHALQGARQTRWDYTMAMLYYSTCLKSRGSSTSFRIGGLNLSSIPAAIQCIALAWNIGHLPGTFSVEKGVARYLKNNRPRTPLNALLWEGPDQSNLKALKRYANESFEEYGYLSLSRAFAVRKLLKLSSSKDDPLYRMTNGILAPFLLNYEDEHSPKWQQIRDAFVVIRHAAYLSVDYSIAGIHWGPDVSPLVREMMGDRRYEISELSATISEILSPLEREVYKRLYHSKEARTETAIVASKVERHLEAAEDPEGKIDRWTKRSLFRDLQLGRIIERGSAEISATIRLRSLFSNRAGQPEDTERSMAKAGISLPLVSEYRSWNSDSLLEPDEFLFDAASQKGCTCEDVGNLFVWFFDRFESRLNETSSSEPAIERLTHGEAYLGLVRRAIEITYPGISVRIEPWSMHRFGVFPNEPRIANRVPVWASDSLLEDRTIKHIVRDRSRIVCAEDWEAYSEILGLAALRRYLKARWRDVKPRQRCLVLTSSIRFTREGKDLIEYDGAILTVAARSGKMTWYGLETKTNGQDPVASLRKRLEVLGVDGDLERLKSKSVRSAVARIPLHG